jgi:transposase-like protein
MNPRYDRALRERVLALAESGASVRAIARDTGRSPTRVYALLRECGAKTKRAS